MRWMTVSAVAQHQTFLLPTAWVNISQFMCGVCIIRSKHFCLKWHSCGNLGTNRWKCTNPLLSVLLNYSPIKASHQTHKWLFQPKMKLNNPWICEPGSAFSPFITEVNKCWSVFRWGLDRNRERSRKKTKWRENKCSCGMGSKWSRRGIPLSDLPKSLALFTASL